MFAKRWDSESVGSVSSWLGAGLLGSPWLSDVLCWAPSVWVVSLCNLELEIVFCAGLDLDFKQSLRFLTDLGTGREIADGDWWRAGGS